MSDDGDTREPCRECGRQTWCKMTLLVNGKYYAKHPCCIDCGPQPPEKPLDVEVNIGPSFWTGKVQPWVPKVTR